MNLNEWQTIAKAGFRRVRSVYGGDAKWWPRQRESTVVAWGIAIETIIRRANRNQRLWFSACRGSDWDRKATLLADCGIAAPNGDDEAPASMSSAWGFSAREYLLDVTMWPSENEVSDMLLSMESECYSQSGVGGRVEPNNGYAYDYYKLMLVASPIRLFVCRVNGDNARRDRLLNNLTALTRNARATKSLRSTDELSLLIIPTSLKNRSSTISAVWCDKFNDFDVSRFDIT